MDIFEFMDVYMCVAHFSVELNFSKLSSRSHGTCAGLRLKHCKELRLAAMSCSVGHLSEESK